MPREEPCSRLSRAIRARIVVADSDASCEVIAGIADLLPTANIFVLTKNLTRRRALAEGVARCTQRQVSTEPRTMWSQPNKLYFGTLVQFYAIGTSEWDVIIFADAESALAKRGLSRDPWLRGARMYVLTSSDQSFDPDDAIRLEMHFGEVVYHAVGDSDHPRAVTIQIATPPWSPPAGDVDALERKRQLFWHNERRNGALAQIAHAFRARDLPTLWNHGVLLNEPEYFERFKVPPTVAVLVESPEHAQHLASLVGWPAMTSVPHRAAPASCPHEQVIVTSTWTYQHRVAVDVIVRGDGTGSSWLPQWGPRQHHTPEEPLTIVDFADDADKLSVVDTNRRLRSYMANGWDVPTRRHGDIGSTEPRPGTRT